MVEIINVESDDSNNGSCIGSIHPTRPIGESSSRSVLKIPVSRETYEAFRLSDYEFKVKSLLERCIRRTRRRFSSKAIIGATNAAARSAAIGGMADVAFRALMDMDRQVDDDPYMNLELSDDDKPTNPTGDGGGGATDQEEEYDSVVEVLKMKKRKKKANSEATTVRGKGNKAKDMAVVMKDQTNVDMPTVYDSDFDVESQKLNQILYNEKTQKIYYHIDLEEQCRVAASLNSAIRIILRRPELQVDYAKCAIQKASEKWQEDKKKLVGVSHSINRESFDRVITQIKILNLGLKLVTEGASCDYVVENGQICTIDPNTKDVIKVPTGVVIKKGVSQSARGQSGGTQA
ncbi:ATPase/histidine kinase/DNA gyrase B/HSP90 domain protein [Sesbania bispinosa]|nr:ATPase/histidine kinase/DNA gyrase B/HSP90 domain protein [Sesbania bispinosa]